MTLEVTVLPGFDCWTGLYSPTMLLLVIVYEHGQPGVGQSIFFVKSQTNARSTLAEPAFSSCLSVVVSIWAVPAIPSLSRWQATRHARVKGREAPLGADA